MPEPALEEILAIEREIQARIEEEQRRTEEWLSAKRESLIRENEKKVAAVRREFDQLIANAEEDAERKVTAEIKRAEGYADFLDNLPDEVLSRYLWKYLHQILPENES